MKGKMIIICLIAQVALHTLPLLPSTVMYVFILGQIELYTHIPVMKQLVLQLQQWTFRLCGVFLLDSQFLTDAAKYFSGVMTSLSTMVMLELPHINVMGKLDLLDKKTKSDIERYVNCVVSALLYICHAHCYHRYLDPDTSVLLNELKTTTDKKFHKLNKAICSLVSKT